MKASSVNLIHKLHRRNMALFIFSHIRSALRNSYHASENKKKKSLSLKKEHRDSKWYESYIIKNMDINPTGFVHVQNIQLSWSQKTTKTLADKTIQKDQNRTFLAGAALL